ncbi:uncharacterized UDP-glucosyltransferase YjiC [Arthrobacter sp. Hiyo6]|nr:uncharacterized UDP-glucosyltransferase YjiC [Arthrobacter sp. Hiyo6]
MHLSFISIPAAGHVNPTLAVVAELVRRGHRVTYFTATTFAKRVERAGAEFRASGQDWFASLPIGGPALPDRRQLMLPVLKRVFQDIRPIFPPWSSTSGRTLRTPSASMP